MNDMISLKEGDIKFGRWKNRENNDCILRAVKDIRVQGIKDKEMKQIVLAGLIKEWQIAYSIFHGEGFLKGDTVEKTKFKIDELDVIEASKLGDSFDKFQSDLVGDVAKKVKES